MRNYSHFKNEARISDGLKHLIPGKRFHTLCPELIIPPEVLPLAEALTPPLPRLLVRGI